MGTAIAYDKVMTRVLEAAIFDMDGVFTRTAEMHAAAWKEAFDQVLHSWAEAHGTPVLRA